MDLNPQHYRHKLFLKKFLGSFAVQCPDVDISLLPSCRKFIAQSEDLYESIEEAGWWYTQNPLDFTLEE